MQNQDDLTPEEKLFQAIFGVLPESKSLSPLDEAAQKEAGDRLKERIEAVLKTLTYREREIIKLRYGLGDGYTYNLEEVGRIFKVTRERVRQIEAKAVSKLQHPLRAKKIEGLLEADETAKDIPPKD
jgi:RNA polymerase primary sigma factor